MFQKTMSQIIPMDQHIDTRMKIILKHIGKIKGIMNKKANPEVAFELIL